MHPYRQARQLLWFALLALAGGCDEPPGDAPVRDTLVGTWLREYRQDGVPVRRVLVLEADGHFSETWRAGPPTAEAHANAGDWLFDGTNLKRHYTRVDGEKPARPLLPFATFELKFASRNDFTGLDRVHGNVVEYHRVADGTQP
jgi:hypothetical protein